MLNHFQENDDIESFSKEQWYWIIPFENDDIELFSENDDKII